MADPLTPEERRRFDFERLNRAERRALAHRAKRSRRSPWEQWRLEHPIFPREENEANRITIVTSTTVPAHYPKVFTVESLETALSKFKSDAGFVEGARVYVKGS